MDLPIKSIDELRTEGEAAALAEEHDRNPYPQGSDCHHHWECGYIAALREQGDD